MCYLSEGAHNPVQVSVRNEMAGRWDVCRPSLCEPGLKLYHSNCFDGTADYRENENDIISISLKCIIFKMISCQTTGGWRER